MGTSPVSVNVGNTGFMLLCASLVMLMTPGLAFFYGGLVARKNVLSIMMQSYMSLGWTTVLWIAFGYSMCFGPDIHGIIGNPMTYALLKGVTLTTMFTGNDAGIPLVVHIAYQMMFAIITPALITGRSPTASHSRRISGSSPRGSSSSISRLCICFGARMGFSRSGALKTLPVAS